MVFSYEQCSGFVDILLQLPSPVIGMSQVAKKSQMPLPALPFNPSFFNQMQDWNW